MVQVTLDEVADKARSLRPDEQRQLRDLLDSWLASSMSLEEREEEVLRRLHAKGVVSRVAPPVTDLRPYRDRKPIEIEGEPLSQTIIRDRDAR